MFIFIGMGTMTFGVGVFGLAMSKLPARTKRSGAITLAILWYGIGIATCAYYYSAVGLADFSKNSGRSWWMLLYGTLGLVPVLAGLPKNLGKLGCALYAVMAGIGAGGPLGLALGSVAAKCAIRPTWPG